MSENIRITKIDPCFDGDKSTLCIKFRDVEDFSDDGIDLTLIILTDEARQLIEKLKEVVG